MTKASWFVLLALAAVGSALGQAAADEPARPQPGGADTAFPAYSRQDEAEACLYGYGVDNTSTLDCVARDEQYRAALSKKWAELAENFKKDRVSRLSVRHLNSYFYLDHCIQVSKEDSTTPN